MASEEPAFLTAGIEVSAKYRGAFCEAKIKKVDKNVKCKVTLKDDGKVLVVQDEDIKGMLRVGATVEVKRPDSGQFVEGTVNRISDLSIYTVVFDDGDENTLRRTKLCLKGDRHFMKSETLDDLPLTHPEHFGTPVVKKAQKSKTISTATCSESDSEVDSSDDDSDAGKRTYSIHSQQNLVGRVLCMDFEERSRRTVTVPVLVVLPSADDVQLPSRHHILVKSFKDGKFLTTTISNTKEFTAEIVAKNKDKVLKSAFDKAQSYKDHRELPQNWNKMELLGYSSGESGESSDDEPDEKKDRFVAELFKFMDDRGTPINKAPNLGGFDLNLFKLFRIVQSMGGYNRVTNQMKWHVVNSKLNLPVAAPIVSTSIKQAYKKYLHAFEDFNRKLGCTMVMSSHSRMSNRSLVSFRERERDQTPKLIRSRRIGSVKEEDGDRTKVELEADRGDKLSTSLPISKMISVAIGGEEGGGASGGGEGGVTKIKMPKKQATKKDSGDSDSVSSDTVFSSRFCAVPSVTKTSTDSKSLGDSSVKTTKEAEKTIPGRPSFQSVKEEATRVTRGESLKSKEERTERSRTITKGEAKMKVETEKSADKTDSEKEDKHKGSRRLLRRAMNIPNTEDDGEDETRSTNSDKVKWDESSKINFGSINDESKTEESELLKPITGRRHISCDDVYAVGTRMQVKYGKGKGQKIYEAKILETSIQSGVIKYFVHYNGWNSRYDEWISKDVIVNVLEEPVLEMPKLRSSVTPSAKSQMTSVRKKGSLQSTSPTLCNKDDSKFHRGKASSSGIEAGRRTRSNSLDQVKALTKTPGRVKGANLKTLETGSNSSISSSLSSSSSLLSSSAEVEEKENLNDQPESECLESKPEQNLDEEFSNSYHSGSPMETPEMPDIYASEEDEMDKENTIKLMDQEATTGETTCHDDIPPVMELASERIIPSEQLPEISFLEKASDISAEEETLDRSDASDQITVDKSQHLAFSIVQQSSEIGASSCELEEISGIKETVPLAVESTLIHTDAQVIDVDNNKYHRKVMSFEEGMKAEQEAEPMKAFLPELVESNDLLKTRRKKKSLDKPLEMTDNVSGVGDKTETTLDVKKLEELKAVLVLDTSDVAKRMHQRKRKRSISLGHMGASEKEHILKAVDLETGDEVSKKIGCGILEMTSRKSLHQNDTSGVVSIAKLFSKKPKLFKTGIEEFSKESESLQKQADVCEPIEHWKLDLKSESKETDIAFNERCKSICKPNIRSEKEAEECVNHNEIFGMESVEPSLSFPDPDIDDRIREEANLLSDFAAECNKEVNLKNVFNDSPPASAENSPSVSTAQDDGSSPSQEEQTSTKSEQEANMEVEAYMGGGGRRLETSLCCDSQSGYEFSTASSDSTNSSSSSIHGSDNDVQHTIASRKKKLEEDHRGLRKRRKEKHVDEDNDKSLASKTTYRSDLNDSDQDNNVSKLCRNAQGSSPSKTLQCSASSSHRQHNIHRTSKYNFIDLEEGKYMEGEDRILFLTNKIQDLRAAYMELKAEVASIDRRRRRHRVKEKELAQLSVVGSNSSSTTTST